MLATIQFTTFFVFSSAIKNRKKFNYIKNYNFAIGSVWVWNLVSDIVGGTWTEDVWKQNAEENMWTEERWSDRRLDKSAQWKPS
jgi:hypothetical protein